MLQRGFLLRPISSSLQVQRSIKKMLGLSDQAVRQFSTHQNGFQLSAVPSSLQDVIFELPNEKHPNVAVLSFNRQQQRNALGVNMVNELLSCLEFVKFNHTEHQIRCLIINSAVKGTFCAGADLKERSQMTQQQTSQFVTKLRNLMNDVENLPIPTIAAINGYCLGGGMELSLACDFRVGVLNKQAENLLPYYGLVETSLAIIPGAGGTVRLPRLIGVSKAKELIYTAKKINVKEAFEKYGILNDVLVVDQTTSANEDSLLIDYIVEQYGKPISQNGPIAVKMAKQAIQQGIQLDVANAMKTEELCYAQVIPTKDRIEGLTAFKEKRKPNYKGE
ncbi:hypothetical protein C9374_001757 [Naegleria lovaniensis]|uniref:Enoyl-CoA hydratase n=1 Tax=Naegleria lovaniensis TaxID=51637 RepID=A0AA88GR94_NAELO|nr:uncharacterized protein C9374_001757 [Naegleria lovaniensis]KAG2387425.1 hypothetical protein C9374_001757 [Naegleria lovaniensis]